MGTKQLFKTAFLMVMALLVISFTTNAEAIVVKLPSGPGTGTGCPSTLPTGTKCVGGYNLTDMGQFENLGNGALGEWIPDQQFMATMVISNFDQVPTTAPVLWSLGPDWLSIITPTKSPAVTGRFERRFYAPDNDRALAGKSNEMRLAIKVAEASQHVNVYLSECFEMRQDGIEISTTCGDHGTPINPNVTRVKMFAMNSSGDLANINPLKVPKTVLPGTEHPFSDIESVKWVEKNSFGAPYMNEIATYSLVSYNLGKRFWNPVPAFQPDTNLHFNWTPIPDGLAENQTATFEVKVKDITEPALAQTIIKSVSDMPIVLATFKSTEYNILKEKEKKSGKIVIKAEEVEVTVNNISVREVLDPDGISNALVIQWPEPDIALFGGLDMPMNSSYEVKIWVGTGPAWAGMDYPEVYLWYDVPAQMGTVVVDGASYATLLAKMEEEGFSKSDLRVMLHYRENYNGSAMPQIPDTSNLTYYNRTQSAWVPINTF